MRGGWSSLRLYSKLQISLIRYFHNISDCTYICYFRLQTVFNHFDAIFLLGSLSAKAKNFNTAEKFLNKAIQIQPDNITAYSNLGILFKELRNFKKSLSCYQKAIQIQPNRPRLHNDLGIVFKELREFKKSKKKHPPKFNK